MSESQTIIADPAMMMGKPVVSGTRITVELILEKLARGETMEEILQAHPRLTLAGIFAALDFGARSLRADVVYPIALESVRDCSPMKASTRCVSA
jgi:uncharacterized protein (DUF433 family)